MNGFDPSGLEYPSGGNFSPNFGLEALVCGEWHYQRNLNQAGVCPWTLDEVNDGDVCGDSDFELYPHSGEGDFFFHPGGYYDVRGAAGGPMEGVQCIYDEYGSLVQTHEGAGTWDYSPPGGSSIGHVLQDILPWFICSGDGPAYTEPP